MRPLERRLQRLTQLESRLHPRVIGIRYGDRPVRLQRTAIELSFAEFIRRYPDGLCIRVVRSM
jgi:hypothetical protein